MTQTLPATPAKLFLVGIGGIGMSGLAQMLVHLGYEVAGSDRNLDSPAQKKLFKQLASQGIKIVAQDGLGAKELNPDCLIISSAIEETNADLKACPNALRLHRSQALFEAVRLSGLPSIAVAGSCGKTSVTGWVHSALCAAGKSAMLLNGGYSLNHNQGESFPGNFLPGTDFIVFEADESDGSLVNYEPEIGLLMNLGDDHHSEEKLRTMFSTFLSRCRDCAITADYLQDLAKESPDLITVGNDGEIQAKDIKLHSTGASFSCEDEQATIRQQGNFSVSNALFVYATLKQCGISSADAAKALNNFHGVHRRLELCGELADGRPVFDDYAHNPQKIAAVISTVQQSCDGGIDIFFQPHGYGPLGFMQDALLRELKACLHPQSRFYLLPVFYAGGTTSFKPSSEEVCDSYRQVGFNCLAVDKDAVSQVIEQGNNKAALILGARDPELNNWVRSLCKPIGTLV